MILSTAAWLDAQEVVQLKGTRLPNGEVALQLTALAGKYFRLSKRMCGRHFRVPLA
jgi:hypothetical protein